MIKIKMFFLLFLMIGHSAYSNDEHTFLADLIKVNESLNYSTIAFQKALNKSPKSENIKAAINEYNGQIVNSLNLLLPHTKVDNKTINGVAGDLRTVLSDLVKNNYGFLGYVNSSPTKDELKKQIKDFLSKNDFTSGFFKEITLGACMTAVKEKPEKEKADKQYLKLTKEDRDDLHQELIKSIGDSVKKGTKIKSKTPFEHSSRMIYEFLSLEWEFENK